ncbi:MULTISPECIES: methyl-accepting chemotaxis protein [unclassified Brevundimonas]|uniref:methyl-accepting chemotaxis protein n=1 Tax=unclassified Brevundimonas TaxID=2622653 RepID=UPI0025BB53C0|nr:MULTISPECIES: globin-coupled sensor protein [unclassified Brevundimonas]
MSDSTALNERLSFIQMDAEARRRLSNAQPVIEGALSSSLDAFYAQVRAYPAVSRFFNSEQMIAGAKSGQSRHWGQISSARFDSTYTDSVQRIGATHARIGLEPRWYIGGYALVLDGLVKAVVSDHEKKRKRFSAGDGGKALGETLGAVVKAALLDMDFVISIYLEAAEKARKEADALRAEAEAAQKRVVEVTASSLARLADGDLTTRIHEEFSGDYAQLKTDFNAAMERLEAAMQEVSENVGLMRAGANEISGASDDLSSRTERQASSLQQTAAALDEITVTVKRTADGAQKAHHVVSGAKSDAERSSEVVSDAVTAMGEIESSSDQISRIIGVIDEIAFQTNLLALNAGVEAARAGDAGRGFAVVASEVRALAQRSADAAKEIKTLISSSTQQVKNGVKLVGQTGEVLSDIVNKVSEIAELMNEISASAKEQATTLTEVNSAVNQMDQTTQQNAAMVEQSTAACHHLTSEAEKLTELVSKFKVARSVAAPVRAMAGANAAPIRTAHNEGVEATLARRAAPAAAKANLALAASADWEEF